MPDSRLDIVIGSRAELAGLDQSRRGVRDLKAEAQDAGNSLRTALTFAGVGAGVVSVDRLVSGLVSATKTGIDFNSTMEQARLGVAALLNQFKAGEFDTFNDRVEEAGRLLDQLRDKGIIADATFEQLLSAFTGTSGNLFAAGVSDFEKQFDLVIAASNALTIAGGSQDRLFQELKDLTTGNITADDLIPRQLGLTGEQLRGFIANGRLFEELMERMAPLVADAENGMGTLAAQVTYLQEQFTTLTSKVSLGAFEELKKSLGEINELLEDPAFIEGLKPLGEGAKEVIGVFMELAKWGLKNADTLIEVGKAATFLGSVYAALKIGQLIASLGRLALGHLEAAAAIKAETAALNANTLAQDANNRARALSVKYGGVVSRGVNASGDLASSPTVLPAGGPGRIAGLASLVISNIGSVILAGAAGLTIGKAIEERFNPLRGAFGKIFGTYSGTFDSGRDAAGAASLNDSFNARIPGLTQQATGFTTVEQQAAIRKQLQDEIAALEDRRVNAQRGTRREIDLQLNAYRVLLQTVDQVKESELERQQVSEATARNRAFAQSFLQGDFSTAAAGIIDAANARRFTAADDPGKLGILQSRESDLRSRIAAYQAPSGKDQADYTPREVADLQKAMEAQKALQENLGQQDALNKQIEEAETRRELTRQTLELERQIEDAKTAGNTAEEKRLTAALERLRLLEQLRSQGFSSGEAGSLADLRLGSRRISDTQTAAPEFSADRFTRIGLLFGDQAQQLNIAQQQLNETKAMHATIKELKIGQRNAVGPA